jgi:hypothetical protein
MAMKLLDLYKSMLSTADCTVTSDWLVSSKLMGQVLPVMVKGKRLALPAPEILAKQDKNDIIIFHPLMEQVVRGESEVLEKYRKLLMVRFNSVASTLISDLLLLSGDIDKHKDLSPDQAEFLTKVKGVDDKLIKLWARVLAAMPHDQTSRRIVTLFLKKTGSVAGKRHKRVGVVSFPLYEELKKPEIKKEDHEIYGIKCRVKDKEILIAALEYLFPNIEEVGSYNRGSDSDVAVNLDALMQPALGLIQAMNDVSETFGDLFGKDSDDADLYIDCQWQEAFVNLGVMWNEIRKVPMQAGNEGIDPDNPGTPAIQSAHPGLPAAYQPQVQPPTGLHLPDPQQYQPPPINQKPVTPTDNPSLDAFLAARDAERAQQRQFEQGWKTVTHQPPPGTVQQPVYLSPHTPFIPQQQQPVYQPPPQPVHTGRGLDFGSVLAANPNVLYATGGPAMQGMYPPMQQQQPLTSRYFSQWQTGGGQPQGYYPPPQQQPIYPPQQPQQQAYYQQPQGGYHRSI